MTSRHYLIDRAAFAVVNGRGDTNSFSGRVAGGEPAEVVSVHPQQQRQLKASRQRNEYIPPRREEDSESLTWRQF